MTRQSKLEMFFQFVIIILFEFVLLGNTQAANRSGFLWRCQELLGKFSKGSSSEIFRNRERIYRERALPFVKIISVKDLGEIEHPKKDQSFNFEYRAPRLGSAADRILRVEGMSYAFLSWVIVDSIKAPFEGVEVHDHFKRKWTVSAKEGQFVYRLKEDPSLCYWIDKSQFLEKSPWYLAQLYEVTVQGPQFAEPHMIRVTIGLGGPFRIEEIVEVLSEIPDVLIYSIEKINGCIAGHSTFGIAAEATSDGEITIYPWANLDRSKGIGFLKLHIIHESGHTLAGKIWGTTKPGSLWKLAKTLDGSSVSDYGDTRLNEDFAEAVRIFVFESSFPHKNRGIILEAMLFRDHPLREDYGFRKIFTQARVRQF